MSQNMVRLERPVPQFYIPNWPGENEAAWPMAGTVVIELKEINLPFYMYIHTFRAFKLNNYKIKSLKWLITKDGYFSFNYGDYLGSERQRYNYNYMFVHKSGRTMNGCYDSCETCPSFTDQPVNTSITCDPGCITCQVHRLRALDFFARLKERIYKHLLEDDELAGGIFTEEWRKLRKLMMPKFKALSPFFNYDIEIPENISQDGHQAAFNAYIDSAIEPFKPYIVLDQLRRQA